MNRSEDRSRDLRAQIGDEPEPDEAAPNSGMTRLLIGLLGILGIGLLVTGILVSITLSPAGGSILAVFGTALFTAAAFLFLEKPFVGHRDGIARVSADQAADQRGR